MNTTEGDVGTVSAVWRFPVKSMLGEELNAGEVTQGGIVGDRAYGRSRQRMARARGPRAAGYATGSGHGAALPILGSSATAHGAMKERVVVERFTDSFAFSVDCAEFGPYAFENLVSGTQRITVVEILDQDGELLQTVFHIAIRETETNSVTGKSLRLSGTIREEWDYAANTRTLSGKVWLGNEPGEGPYVHDSGRITMTLDTRVASFLAGPKEAFFGGGVDVPVCAALAAD